jgi:phosphatidylserine/phosphatidylglycerophosphate/cardiolipin synthase-like enzyme
MFKQSFTSSKLYDQTTFYEAFLSDIRHCKRELIIESPFVRLRRIDSLMPTLSKLRQKGVHIVINTRDPYEHEPEYEMQAQAAVDKLQAIGVQVLYTVKHHRKLAIIDRKVTWEGSLNILSHSDSAEIMRRINSEADAKALIRFIKLPKYIKKGVTHARPKRLQAFRYLSRRKSDSSSNEVPQV